MRDREEPAFSLVILEGEGQGFDALSSIVKYFFNIFDHQTERERGGWAFKEQPLGVGGARKRMDRLPEISDTVSTHPKERSGKIKNGRGSALPF